LKVKIYGSSKKKRKKIASIQISFRYREPGTFGLSIDDFLKALEHDLRRFANINTNNETTVKISSAQLWVYILKKGEDKREEEIESV